MIRSMFISRDPDQVPELLDFCEQKGIRLSARSLIRFEGIEAHPEEPFQLIFFPSIRAAQYFLEYNTLEASISVACIGKQTAEKLRSYGLQPAFIGEKAGDPESVARSFASFAGAKRVLIPSSTESNRTLQRFLPEEQVETLVVYKTLPDPAKIDPHELYAFSSPSNLHAFLEANSIPQGAGIIAWGKTTLKAMDAVGLECTHALSESSTEELIEWIKKGDQS